MKGDVGDERQERRERAVKRWLPPRRRAEIRDGTEWPSSDVLFEWSGSILRFPIMTLRFTGLWRTEPPLYLVHTRFPELPPLSSVPVRASLRSLRACGFRARFSQTFSTRLAAKAGADILPGRVEELRALLTWATHLEMRSGPWCAVFGAVDAAFVWD